MGTPAWDLGPRSIGDWSERPESNPQLTVCCTYHNTSLPPTCVTFGLSHEYGFTSAREAHDWFLRMVAEHEEFEVETDQPGEEAMPFWSGTVRGVMME